MSDVVLNPLKSNPITKARISSSNHWDLVAVNVEGETTVRFFLQDTRDKDHTLSLSVPEATLLLAMKENPRS